MFICGEEGSTEGETSDMSFEDKEAFTFKDEITESKGIG